MHVSKEFLLEAVGLSLVVALLVISMQLFQKAGKITSMLEAGQEQYINELEEYEIIKFEGLDVDGMTAVNYIKRMVVSYKLPVQITTSKGSFVVSEATECNWLRDADSDYYMNPLAKYQCEVIRDENNVIKNIKMGIVKEGD